MRSLVLKWKRFRDFLTLREEFRSKPCIYLQTDPEEKLLRIGQSANLYERYKGGTAYAMQAAMHGSGNLVFVTEAPEEKKAREDLEKMLIYDYQPRYCNEHKKYPPENRVQYVHEGDIAKELLGQYSRKQ